METPSLFEQPMQAVVVIVQTEKKPHPLAPWFAAIAAVIGETAAKASGGRVARIAKQMQQAGLPAERVGEVVGVVREHWPNKKYVDLSTLQTYWPYILEAPASVSGPTSLDLLAANGGKLLR